MLQLIKFAKIKAALNRIFAIEEYGENPKDTRANPGNCYDIERDGFLPTFAHLAVDTRERFLPRVSPVFLSRRETLYCFARVPRAPKRALSRAF